MNLLSVPSESGTNQISSSPPLLSLKSALEEFALIPTFALFLGLALDGLPVLLNLLDPLPGPILIIGDEKSGKTNFLKALSRSVKFSQPADRLEAIVITNDPSEWTERRDLGSYESVLSAQEASIIDHLHSMNEWAHLNKGEEKIRLLLVDHFELLTHKANVQQDLRWLLLRGPAKHVWPIVSVNSTVAVSGSFKPWLESFRTRLFGHIEDERVDRYLSRDPHASFASVIAGHQFAMREGNEWLPFWIPTAE